MRYTSVMCCLATLVVTLGALEAATIHVPGDYANIQDAINAAVDGDTVLVAPGTYHERVNFLGKAITVTSEQGPDVTIIDGDPRLLDGDGSGEAVIDLGADEFSNDVAIQRAEFSNRSSQLLVSAISTAAPDVELFLTVPGCLHAATMPRVGDTYVFREKVPECGNLDGQTATVTASIGGSDTATIR